MRVSLDDSRTTMDGSERIHNADRHNARARAQGTHFDSFCGVFRCTFNGLQARFALCAARHRFLFLPFLVFSRYLIDLAARAGSRSALQRIAELQIVWTLDLG